jgi:hypothetical protein
MPESRRVTTKTWPVSEVPFHQESGDTLADVFTDVEP